MALLEMTGVGAHYGRIQALHEISLTVNEGEVVTLIGANGAGKTTTMRVVSGLRPLSSGSITFDGDDISTLRADLRVVRGISQAPEGRGIFPGMTVLENLDMGAYYYSRVYVEGDRCVSGSGVRDCVNPWRWVTILVWRMCGSGRRVWTRSRG